MEKTTDTANTGQSLDRLNENLVKIEALSQRLVAAMQQRKPVNPTLNAPDAAMFAQASAQYWAQMMQNPSKMFEHQLEFWGQSVKHYIEASEALAKGGLQAPEDDTPDDPRFSNPLWKTHPYFNFVKQQYMRSADAISRAVQEVDGLEDRERRRLDYFARQIIDMMAPTNFLGTNPDALEKAVETEGQSLIDGLENLVADIEANQGELLVRLADEKAFELGRNIATTPGEVVHRNRMMELLQYAPSTETVRSVPLIIYPPWINKFYIMDLKAQNSLIKWIVDQGYTVFVVSWVNPGPDYRDAGLEDYIEQGYLEAIREVRAITGQKQVNAVGYCIAGTALAMTLSLMKQRKDTSIRSATFFTALTDFSDQGEFTPFLQDDFIDGLEDEMRAHGVLRSMIMARTFSFLRSNDLVYRPAIRSYMMGEAPPAFDLLYWNGDGSNLPEKMALQYLRGLCQQNRFAEDGFELFDKTLHLRDVDIPLCSISCETDHIANWKDCYRGVQAMGSGDKTFIVSESGHIAGIVNPPSKKKYGHYSNPDLDLAADDWLASADFNEGSWWPRWEAWLRKHSGRKIKARDPGDSDHPSLGPAPGSYVRARPKL